MPNRPGSGVPTHYVLSLSWEPGFCAGHGDKPECAAETATGFDASHFTLHGLWPDPNEYCGVAASDISADKAGDWNALHRDLYGELVFPLQVVINLSHPGADHTGGEFLLYEQRPRAQSRGTATLIPHGHGLVFTTRDRPVESRRGWSAAPVRHGVSVIRSGERFTLGLVFHDEDAGHGASQPPAAPLRQRVVAAVLPGQKNNSLITRQRYLSVIH